MMKDERYQGEKIYFKGKKLDPVNLRESLLKSVLKALDGRFQEDQTSNPIVKASLVTCLSNWPAATSEQIAGLQTVQPSV